MRPIDTSHEASGLTVRLPWADQPRATSRLPVLYRPTLHRMERGQMLRQSLQQGGSRFRRLVMHEALEDRLLLAVDLSLGDSGTVAMGPAQVSTEKMIVQVINDTGATPNAADFLTGFQLTIDIIPEPGAVGTVGFNSFEVPLNYVLDGVDNHSFTQIETPNDTLLVLDLNFPFAGGIAVPPDPGANLVQFDFISSADADGTFGVFVAPRSGSEWTDATLPTQQAQSFVNLTSTDGPLRIGEVTVESLLDLGDVNGDGTVDAADIDTLYSQFGGQATPQNDLNNDGDVDIDDVGVLVHDILNTEFGDANLDGKVDNADFGVFLGGFGQVGAGWAGGDVDGNGTVGNGDFGQVLGNFGFVRSAAEAGSSVSAGVTDKIGYSRWRAPALPGTVKKIARASAARAQETDAVFIQLGDSRSADRDHRFRLQLRSHKGRMEDVGLPMGTAWSPSRALLSTPWNQGIHI